MELWTLDATALAEAYDSGQTTPVDVVEALLVRIEQLNPLVNAFVALAPGCREHARESAERLKAGAPRGPLEGIPVAVKDSLCVAGMQASWGSPLFAGRIREGDELPIRRLRDAGAIFVGKTNTPEFALEGYTANDLYGVTGNPWNPDLTPGGSSGGSVAAVAAGFVPVAIGTDGGGSIRRPAAYNGLFGLKPTIGRVPRDGGLPQLLLDFEVVGPFARSVNDCRLIYSVLAGADRHDPRSRRFCDSETGADTEGDLRVLYVERIGGAPCDPHILASCAEAAENVRALGHDVTAGDLPFDLSGFNRFWMNIAQVGLARLHRDMPEMDEKAGSAFMAMAARGAAVPAAEFAAGLETIDRLRGDVSRMFADYDLVMMPACAAMPWPADTAWPDRIDGEEVGPRGHAVYTGWVNGCGHPAVAIPAQPAPDGMPIGFQLIGDLGSEVQLLSVAADFEARIGGWKRWPDLDGRRVGQA
jgi:aspartyl-tRNA(Asn)/glutamyl-tRNA(Gln) amidotransferase subunit A